MSDLDSESTPLMRNRDPPPPYAVVTGMLTSEPPPQPVHPELQTHRSQTYSSVPRRSPQPPDIASGQSRNQKSIFWLVLVLVVVCVPLALMIRYVDDDTPDAVNRERIRQGWQIERAQWAQEDQRHRARLAREEHERQEDLKRWRREEAEHAKKIQEDVERWRHEKDEHDKEIQRWREERDRARQLGSIWDRPQDAECLAYNVRDRVVRFHGPSLCKIAAVNLGNRTVMAESCTVQNDQIVGHFEETGDPECRPKWGEAYDKGCVSLGENHRTHRVEARLWGLRHGDDWKRMCNTTPATVNGVQFSEPTRCENRGVIDGMVGMLEYDDPACR